VEAVPTSHGPAVKRRRQVLNRFAVEAALTNWRGFAIVATAAVLLILVAGRSASFYSDDWWYILGRSLGDPRTWFVAENEHWVTLHVIAFRLIYETFGTGSYLPYLLTLMIAHVSAAAALFVLLRRVSSGWTPIAATSVFLLLGSGYYNLFWGFQMGMVGALALGLWALVALPRRPWVACLLLTLGIATVGNALFVVAASFVYLALTRRRYAPLMLVPVAAYAIWWFVIGSETARTGPPIGAGNLDWVLAFPIGGLSAWFGGVAGIGPTFGLVALAITPVLLYMSRPLAPLSIAAIFGLLAQAAVLAISRGVVNPPGSAHYIYDAAPFVLIVAASVRVPRLVARSAFVWALGINIALVIYWGTVWPIARGNPVVTCRPAETQPWRSICLTQF
jgi:hypothetical protein